MTDAPSTREPIGVVLRRDALEAMIKGIGRLNQYSRQQLSHVSGWLDELRPGERLIIERHDENSRPRPRLPRDPGEVRETLTKEIGKHSPDEIASPNFAETVAETIIRDYYIRPELTEQFVRLGLTDAIMELLVLDSEGGGDAEVRRLHE